MSPDINWSKMHLNNVKPIVSFDKSQNGEFQEAVTWKNNQTVLMKNDILQKDRKFLFREY